MSPRLRRVLPVILATVVYLPIAVFALAMSQMGDCEIGNAACESGRASGFWRVFAVVVLAYLVLAYGVDRFWRR